MVLGRVGQPRQRVATRGPGGHGIDDPQPLEDVAIRHRGPLGRLGSLAAGSGITDGLVGGGRGRRRSVGSQPPPNEFRAADPYAHFQEIGIDDPGHIAVELRAQWPTGKATEAGKARL